TVYRYHIDLDGGQEYTGTDLKSGAQGGNLQEGLESLLSFLSAAGEAYAYRMRGRAGWISTEVSEDSNESLFEAPIPEWAHQNAHELSMHAIQLEEQQLIEE